MGLPGRGGRAGSFSSAKTEDTSAVKQNRIRQGQQAGDELLCTGPKIVQAHFPTLRTFIRTGDLFQEASAKGSDLESWPAANGLQRIDKIQQPAGRCMVSFSRQVKDEMDWLEKIKSFRLIDFYKQNPSGTLQVESYYDHLSSRNKNRDLDKLSGLYFWKVCQSRDGCKCFILFSVLFFILSESNCHSLFSFCFVCEK